MNYKVYPLLLVFVVLLAGLMAQTTTLSVGTQIAAANVTQGALKHPIYHFQLVRDGVGEANLSAFNFTTTGTYAAAHVNKFQLWYNTSNDLSTATQVNGDVTTDLGPTMHSFPPLAQALVASSTSYFWITTDVAINATKFRNIKVSAFTTSNFSVSSGSKFGSASAGGTQTITAFATLSTDYFRSFKTGNWSAVATWQSSHDNINWATATLSPASSARDIAILSAHTVSTDIDVTTGPAPITIASGGKLSVRKVFESSVIISGAGAFTLNSGCTFSIYDANGITSSAASGAIQVTGTRFFSTGASYIYTGSSAQVTGDGLPASVTNLTVNNAAGVNFTNVVTVNGVFTQANGEGSGNVLGVDGYSSPTYKRLEITEDGNLISGFSTSSSTISSPAEKIDREWALSGNFTGTKTVTFYWDAADDNDFNWAAYAPAVYVGATQYLQTAYNVSSNPRWVTASLTSFDAKAIYTIGREDGGTLPVELSSFTAISTAGFFVKLHWTTQSETGVSGFYIYRGLDSNVANAIAISPMISATNTSDVQNYEFTDNELYESAIYYYWLAAQEMDGSVAYHGPNTIYYSANTNGTQDTPAIPIVSGLQAIYPNPFNPNATISYGLKDAATVEFTIYNSRGQTVRNFNAGQKAAGNWKESWNGTDNSGKVCSSGVYYIKMQAGKDSFMRKAVLAK